MPNAMHISVILQQSNGEGTMIIFIFKEEETKAWRVLSDLPKSQRLLSI